MADMQTTKSPLCGYYGGKANIAHKIARLIHSAGELRFYAEPFAGGASVYFALPPKKNGFYVLNDTNAALINFYEVMQSDFAAFYDLVRARGLYAKKYRERALEIYKGAAADKIERAWAVWYCLLSSFCGQIDSSFGRNPNDKTHVSRARTLQIRISALRSQAEMLTFAVFECEDALTFIRRYGREGNMLYIDPPYIGRGAGDERRADLGHYKGYTPDDFAALIALLDEVKCRWVLSSYNDRELMEWAKAKKYGIKEIPVTIYAGLTTEKKQRRAECLYYNFPHIDSGLL